MRRPLALTVVPILALAGAITWAVMQFEGVESRGDPQLYERALAWERSMTEPGTRSPAEFVHPAERSSAEMRRWLPDVTRLFGGAAGTQILQAKAGGGGEGATTFVIQGGGVAGGTGTIEFRWAREKDGVWYVVPRFRESLR